MNYIYLLLIFFAAFVIFFIRENKKKKNNKSIENTDGITFEEDENIEKLIENYANQTVGYVKDVYDIDLDWSEESIESVELILGMIHISEIDEHSSEEEIYEMAKLYGSYVGQVYKKHHSGTWGMTTVDGESLPGLKTGKDGMLWPWAKVYKRLLNGSEDNVWHYYQFLITMSKK